MPAMHTHIHTHTVTIYSPFLRHQRDSCGCRWWWCDLYGLWVLWDEWGLRVHLVQELPDDHRHFPSDYCHRRGQVSILYVHFLKQIDSMPLVMASVQKQHIILLLVLLVYISTSSSSFLIHCWPQMSSSSGPELYSTVPPWKTWAPSPVWSPTLTTSPPATRSLRRVSQPIARASLRLKLDPLVVCSVLKVWGGPEGLCVLLSVIAVSTAASVCCTLQHMCVSPVLQVVVTSNVVLDMEYFWENQ